LKNDIQRTEKFVLTEKRFLLKLNTYNKIAITKLKQFHPNGIVDDREIC